VDRSTSWTRLMRDMCLTAVQQTPNCKYSWSLAFQWQSGPTSPQVLCFAPLDSFPDCCWTLGTRHRHIAQTRLHIVWYHLRADGIYVYDMMANHKQVSLLRTYKQLWNGETIPFSLC